MDSILNINSYDIASLYSNGSSSGFDFDYSKATILDTLAVPSTVATIYRGGYNGSPTQRDSYINTNNYNNYTGIGSSTGATVKFTANPVVIATNKPSFLIVQTDPAESSLSSYYISVATYEFDYNLHKFFDNKQLEFKFTTETGSTYYVGGLDMLCAIGSARLNFDTRIVKSYLDVQAPRIFQSNLTTLKLNPIKDRLNKKLNVFTFSHSDLTNRLTTFRCFVTPADGVSDDFYVFVCGTKATAIVDSFRVKVGTSTSSLNPFMQEFYNDNTITDMNAGMCLSFTDVSNSLTYAPNPLITFIDTYMNL